MYPAIIERFQANNKVTIRYLASTSHTQTVTMTKLRFLQHAPPNVGRDELCWYKYVKKIPLIERLAYLKGEL